MACARCPVPAVLCGLGQSRACLGCMPVPRPVSGEGLRTLLHPALLPPFSFALCPVPGCLHGAYCPGREGVEHQAHNWLNHFGCRWLVAMTAATHRQAESMCCFLGIRPLPGRPCISGVFLCSTCICFHTASPVRGCNRSLDLKPVCPFCLSQHRGGFPCTPVSRCGFLSEQGPNSTLDVGSSIMRTLTLVGWRSAAETRGPVHVVLVR